MHAESCAPNESCALLLGSCSAGSASVSEIVLAGNAAQSPHEFSIGPDELLGAYRAAEQKGKDVVGIFHSHPSSEAMPSETDKKYMEINPIVWVIYSLLTGSFGAFELGPKGITRADII